MNTRPSQLPEFVPAKFGQPFWEATREKRLVLQYCPRTAHYQFFPRPLSIFTAKRDLQWREVSGRATLYSYTLIPEGSIATNEHPVRILAIVELMEGVRMLSNIGNVAVAALRIGMPLIPLWEPLPNGMHLLKFQPEEGSSATAVNC
ncbi:MAG TPA: OB-fold domain-containing protein [Steroidobacteraceae bacterium]